MEIIEQNGLFAISYANDIEQYAAEQVKNILDQPWIKQYNPMIRMMPDTHPGKVGPVGLTMRIDYDAPVMPELIGPDIGCGVIVFAIDAKKKSFSWERLDKVIREKIPVGAAKRQKPLDYEFDYIHQGDVQLDFDRIEKSFGTLGGGNHFIEVDKDDEGNYYLIIHTGSRTFGAQVCDYFLRKGQEELKERGINDVPYEMTYLTEFNKEMYLRFVQECSYFAMENRRQIAKIIADNMKWDLIYVMDKPHNFMIDREEKADVTHDLFIYKGAQEADKEMPVVIPINMKDGVILGRGKGTVDWNYGAPHGSGRLYSRKDVRNHFTVSQFKKEMEGIYSTTIKSGTLDEAPFAYRSLGAIESLISPTVEVTKILKPVYNFKAG